MGYRTNFITLVWDSFTWKRFLNVLLVETEKKLKRTHLAGKPYQLFFDVTNICNLKCPLCPTGLGLKGYPKGNMSFELFKKVIDETSKYAVIATLHNWGESFLNKDIYKMIRYAKSKKICTLISSNLNILTKNDIKEIIDSGLDKLIVSLDGASSETYDIYKRGGNFNTVVRNIELLVAMKRLKKSTKPYIEWQFVVMNHNEHEIEKAKRMAKGFGIVLRLKKLHLNDSLPFTGIYDKKLAEQWLPKNPELKYNYDADYLEDCVCNSLWNSFFINHDGGIFPCCILYDKIHLFGDISRQSFKEIWNNKFFVSSRQAFKNNSNLDLKTVCFACKVFKKD